MADYLACIKGKNNNPNSNENCYESSSKSNFDEKCYESSSSQTKEEAKKHSRTNITGTVGVSLFFKFYGHIFQGKIWSYQLQNHLKLWNSLNPHFAKKHFFSW